MVNINLELPNCELPIIKHSKQARNSALREVSASWARYCGDHPSEFRSDVNIIMEVFNLPLRARDQNQGFIGLRRIMLHFRLDVIQCNTAHYQIFRVFATV